MPTPSNSRPTPRGLTLEAHEGLAIRVRHVLRDLTALRTIVKAALGDGGEAYEAAQEALEAARRTALALAEVLPGSGAEVAEIRALYLTAGAEIARRGHSSSLEGSALGSVNGRWSLTMEG